MEGLTIGTRMAWTYATAQQWTLSLSEDGFTSRWDGPWPWPTIG
jgi:hypothetical protein